MSGNPVIAALIDALDDDALDALASRLAPRLESNTPPQPEVWLNVAEAAEHIGYRDNISRGKRRVYDLSSGDPSFPTHRDGARLLFRASELDRWLRGREEAA